MTSRLLEIFLFPKAGMRRIDPVEAIALAARTVSLARLRDWMYQY
jgi:hypothetical protein